VQTAERAALGNVLAHDYCHGHFLRNADPAAAAATQKTQAMLAALKNGDKVGHHQRHLRTVNGIDGDTVILKIADQVKIRIARSRLPRWRRHEDAK
jgi:preprotein translocase subunit YajC